MRHYNETEVPSVCTTCGFSTRSLGSFMRHTKNCSNNTITSPTAPTGIQSTSDDGDIGSVQTSASTASATVTEPQQHTTLQTCDKCDYSSYDSSEFTLHCAEEHTDNAVHHCDQCNYTCKSKGSLTRHLKYMHKSCGPLLQKTTVENIENSTDQKKKTGKRGRKGSASMTESSDTIISVDPVGGKEEEPLDENEKLLTITRNDEEGVACLQCAYVAKVDESISEHILKVHQKNEHSVGAIPSTDTDGVEKSSHTLSSIHQRSVNRKRKLYSCKECSYTSYDRSKYDRHWLYHVVRQTYKCYTCSYSASVEGNVQRHIARYHPAVSTDMDNGENTNEENPMDDVANTSVEGITGETEMKQDIVDKCNDMIMGNGEVRDVEKNNHSDVITGDRSMSLVNGGKDAHVMEQSVILSSENGTDTNVVTKHDNGIDLKEDGKRRVDINYSDENNIEVSARTEKSTLNSALQFLNEADSELEIRNGENRRIAKLIQIKKANNFSEKSGYAKSFLTFANLQDCSPETQLVKVKIENTTKESLEGKKRNAVKRGGLKVNEIHTNVEVVRVKDEIVDREDIVIKKEIFSEGTEDHLSVSTISDKINEETIKRQDNQELNKCNYDCDTEHGITPSHDVSNISTSCTLSSENTAQESDLLKDEKLTNQEILKNNCDRASVDSSAPNTPDVHIEMFKSPLGGSIRKCLSCDKSYTRYGDMNKHTMRWHSRRLKDCIVTKKPPSCTIEQTIPPPINTLLTASKAQERNEASLSPSNGIASPILSSILISKPGSGVKLIKDMMSIPPPINNSLSKDPMKCAHCPFSSHRIAEIRHHLAGAVKDKYPCRYRPAEKIVSSTHGVIFLPQLIESKTNADNHFHSPVESSLKTETDCLVIKQATPSQSSEINHVTIQPKGQATIKKPVCFVIQPKELAPRVITSCTTVKQNETSIKTEHPAVDQVVLVDNTERKKVVVKLAPKPFAQKFDLRLDNFFPSNSLIKSTSEPKKQIVTISKSPKISPSSSSLLNLRSLLLLPNSMNALDNRNRGISSDQSVTNTTTKSDSADNNEAAEGNVTLEAVLKNDVSFEEGQRLSDGVSRCGRDGCSDEESVEYLTSLMCNVCGFMGDTPDEVIEHSKTHVLKPIYQCVHCEYKTIWKWNTRKHLFNMHKIVSTFPDHVNVNISYEMIESRGDGQKRKRRRKTVDSDEMLDHGGKQSKTRDDASGAEIKSSELLAMEAVDDTCQVSELTPNIEGTNMESSSPKKTKDEDLTNQKLDEDPTNQNLDDDPASQKLISVKCEQNLIDARNTNDDISPKSDETEDLEMKSITASKPKFGKIKTKKIKAENESGSKEEKIDSRCRPWKCSMCDKRSNWRYDVRNHIALHHPNATLIKLNEQEARASYALLVDKFMEQRKLTKGASPIKQRIRFDLSKMSKDVESLNCSKLWDTGLTDTVEETNNSDLSDDQSPTSYDNFASESQSKILSSENKDETSMSKSLISESENKRMRSKHDTDLHEQSTADEDILESVNTNDEDQVETEVPVETVVAVDTPPNDPEPLEYVANPDQIVDETLQKWVDQLKLKRFKCSGCPYRSNFRGDLSRHIKKRHRMASLCVVRVLTVESAAATVGRYRFKWAMEASRLAGMDPEMMDEDAGVMEGDEHQQDIKNNETVVPLSKHMNRFKAPSKKRSAYSNVYETSRSKIRQTSDDARKCCTVCPFITDKSGHLKLHMSYHKPQPRNTYRCQYCPFYVRTARLLDSHLLLHLPRTESVGGGVVVVVGHEEGDYETQNAKKSGAKYKYICDQCPYVGFFRNDYWLHRRHHFEKQSTPLKCSFCRYWVDEERLITQHELLHANTYCPKWIPISTCDTQGSKPLSSQTNNAECRCTFAERYDVRFKESLRCDRELQCPYCCYTVVSVVLMRQHYTTHISCTDAKSTELFSATLDTADDYLAVPCRQKITNDLRELSSVGEADHLPAPVLEREILVDDIVSSQITLDSDLVFEPPMPVLEQFTYENIEIKEKPICYSFELPVNQKMNLTQGVQFAKDLDPVKLELGQSLEKSLIAECGSSLINIGGEPSNLVNLNVKKNHSVSLCSDILEQAMQMAGMLDSDDDGDDLDDGENILRNTDKKNTEDKMDIENASINCEHRGEKLNEVLLSNSNDALPNSSADDIVPAEGENSNVEGGLDLDWKIEDILSDVNVDEVWKIEDIVSDVNVDTDWKIEDIVSDENVDEVWKIEDIVGIDRTETNESNIQIIPDSSDTHAVVQNEAVVGSCESTKVIGERLDIDNENIGEESLEPVETPVLISVVNISLGNNVALLGSDSAEEMLVNCLSSELDLSINDETSSDVLHRSFHEALGLMRSY